MSLVVEHGESVEHLKHIPGGVDAKGYKAPPRWETTLIDNVGVDVPQTTEARDGTVQRADVDLVLFLPPGFQSDSKDRFRIRGHLYEAVSIGEPIKNFFTGDLFRTEVQVKRTNG